MLWHWSPSVIAELAASACLLVIAIYFPWQDFNRRASLIGATLLLVCALWVLSHAIEIGLPDPSYKSYLMGAQLIWGTIAVTFWLLYIVHHIGPRKWLAKRRYVLLAIMPLIDILGVWTNHIHSLIWSNPGLDGHNPYLPLQPTYGVIYWIGMVYVFVLTLAGSFLLISKVVRHHHGRSRESASLLIAAVLPMLVAFAETLGLSKSVKLSIGITPWACFIGTLILVWNLPRFRLHEVIPFARDIIFERIEDCIVVLDKFDRVMDLNPAAERLLGHKIADVLGFSVKQILPQWPDQVDIIDQTIESNKEIVLERGGEQRTYNLRVSIASDPDGHSTSKVVLLADITYRKKAEEALRESEERYGALFDRSLDLVYIHDFEGRFIDANDAALNRLGYTREEIRSLNIASLLSEDQLPIALKTIGEIRETGIQKGLTEFRLRHKNGSDVRVETKGSAILSKGISVAIQSIARDITERKRAEEVLRSEQMMLAQTESVAHVGSWVWDIATDTVTWSDELFRIFQRDPREGAPSFAEHPAFYHPDDMARLGQAVEVAVADGTPYELELRAIRKDGETRVCLARGVAEMALGGRPVRLFGSLQDITERKRAEEAIRVALQEKEVLLREIHHRVKNNMQVISSLFNLRAGHTLNEEGRAILKEAQARIQAMSLVHEKLYQSGNLSRIALGGYINSLAVHLVHFYRPQPGLVRLETDFEDATLDITSAIPCGLLLNELISNALKHAFPENRAGVIRIGLKRGTGGLIEIRVANDGVGFPEGLDFRKTESLGLQIVNLLVGQLDGTIELDRTNGTAFSVTFGELKYASRT